MEAHVERVYQETGVSIYRSLEGAMSFFENTYGPRDEHYEQRYNEFLQTNADQLLVSVRELVANPPDNDAAESEEKKK